VPVIVPKRSQFLQPLVDVLNQAVFGIVDVDARGDVHGRDENHALADAALRQSRLDLRRDIDIFPLFLVRKVRYSVWNCILEIVPTGLSRLTRILVWRQTLN